MSTPVFAANWKMHKTMSELEEFAQGLQKETFPTSAEVIIAGSPHLLSTMVELFADTPVKVAAQNMYFEESGAFTGEISPTQLKDVGVTHVIIGHSERRNIFGETDELLNKKLQAAEKHGLTPIFCIGENLEERETGQAAKVVIGQIEAGLEGLSDEFVQNMIVAYEPIWAIGTGQTATPLQAEGIQSVIKEHLPAQTPLLYGGSVKPANAEELFKQPSVNGFLVGGASLNPQSFAQIWSVA
jgi:triosephosphate isomerase